jgi:hypothetical protein
MVNSFAAMGCLPGGGGLILQRVENSAENISFEPRPLKLGAEWLIVATWPNGKVENITGFTTESEAINWIGSSKQLEWLKARGFKSK